MSRIINGRPVKTVLLSQIEKRCEVLEKQGIIPRLALFRVGENPDDLSYERSLCRTMESLSIQTEVIAPDSSVSVNEVKEIFGHLCDRDDIDGILPFLPLPAEMEDILSLLPGEKDVDGAGEDENRFFPCTPLAVMAMLDHYDMDVRGKKTVVFGRSRRVGEPLRKLLEERGAEVTVIHSKTEEPFEKAKRGEILFSAVGKPRFLDSRYLSAGQTVFDVGINEDPADPSRICGDLDEKTAEALELTYTPVPGGVGEVTVAILADHIVTAAERRLFEKTPKPRRFIVGNYRRKKISDGKPLTQKDLWVMERIAVFIERSKLNSYVEMMGKPGRWFLLNLWAGIGRGIGTAIGLTILAAVLFLILQQIVMLNLPIISNFLAEILDMIDGYRQITP